MQGGLETINSLSAYVISYHFSLTASPSYQETAEFHRVFSTLLFVFCTDARENVALGASSLQVFGDGFAWAGTRTDFTLNHSLTRTLTQLIHFRSHFS